LLAWALVPLVFFTFARNGSLPYVLPSLPPAALLVTQVLDDLLAKFRVQLLLALSGLSPLVLASLTLVIYLFPGLSFLPTQQSTISGWRGVADAVHDKIAYVFDRPYSADFYTRGRALLAPLPGDAVRMSRLNNQEYFAVSTRCLPLIPDELRGRLEQIQEKNATILFRVHANAVDRAEESRIVRETPEEIGKLQSECLLTHPP
jgi:4-amino-4-deoxy-L-arabinose transferase-like glycosyltransferase